MRALWLVLLAAAAGCGQRTRGAQFSEGGFVGDTGDPGANAIDDEVQRLPFKNVLWKHRFNARKISRMTLAGSQLFIETPDHHVIAMDRFSGEVDWMHKVITHTPLDWAPVVASGVPEEIQALEGDLRRIAREIDDTMKEKGVGPETQKLQKDRNQVRERLRYAASGDNVYFLSRQWLYCLDRLQGTLRWSRRLNFAPSAQPFAVRTHVFIPGADLARVWALDVEKKGAEASYYRANIDSRENHVMNRPVYDDPSLFFACHDGNVYAYKVVEGNLTWTYQTERELKADPTVYTHETVTRDDKGKEKVLRTRILFVGGMDSAFYAIDADSGGILWKYECGAEIKTAATPAGRSVYVKTEGGALHAFELLPQHRDPKTGAGLGPKRNGNLRWKLPLGERFLLSGRDRVYVLGAAGEIYAVNEMTGEILGRYPTQHLQHLMSNTGDGLLYAASGAGYVFCLKESKAE